MNSPGGMMQSNMVIDPSAEIVQQLEVLKARTRETADDLRQLASDQESFALQYHNCTSYDGKGSLHSFCIDLIIFEFS